MIHAPFERSALPSRAGYGCAAVTVRVGQRVNVIGVPEFAFLLSFRLVAILGVCDFASDRLRVWSCVRESLPAGWCGDRDRKLLGLFLYTKPVS